jgi:hypothetical protein
MLAARSSAVGTLVLVLVLPVTPSAAEDGDAVVLTRAGCPSSHTLLPKLKPCAVNMSLSAAVCVFCTIKSAAWLLPFGHGFNTQCFILNAAPGG